MSQKPSWINGFETIKKFLFSSGLFAQANQAAHLYSVQQSESESTTDEEPIPEAIEIMMIPEATEEEIQKSIQMVLEKKKNFSHEEAEDIVRTRATLITSTRREVIANFYAKTDYLTGLNNKREGMKRLRGELNRASRNKGDLSLIMVDMDKFKNINDTLGHQTGDIALKILTELMQESSRLEDILVRYGGEEFIMILPNTDTEGAKAVAERFRINVEKNFRNKLKERSPESADKIDEITVKGTVSLGIGIYNRDEIQSPGELIEQADQALYIAKETGRNQTIIFGKKDEEKQKPTALVEMAAEKLIEKPEIVKDFMDEFGKMSAEEQSAILKQMEKVKKTS